MSIRIAINGFGSMGKLGLRAGWAYQTQGLTGRLWWSTAFALAAALIYFLRPDVPHSSDREEATV